MAGSAVALVLALEQFQAALLLRGQLRLAGEIRVERGSELAEGSGTLESGDGIGDAVIGSIDVIEDVLAVDLPE
ncbi:MAG: hypothetical protein V2I51_09085 [Anderseniella sp.]|nr:hypothetical protein [Anderseniella sp.]